MFQPIYTNSFAKDVKLAQKRGENIEKLKKVIELLVNKEPMLPSSFKDFWKNLRFTLSPL